MYWNYLYFSGISMKIVTELFLFCQFFTVEIELLGDVNI